MSEQTGRYQGRQFGNYQLLRLLGTGGSADVYLGRHIYLGTEAAIKILDTRLKASELTQFSQEARTLSTLRHPNIVQILDFGMQEDLPFLVMNYIPQGSLGQRHPAGSRVPLSMIVAYIQSIATALQYAHSQHIVHRDIKPDNLLISNENEIVLSDFGIAVVAHNTHSLRTQEAIGTITYMAPEQLRRKARPASDQYALGVVVYEWLCGAPPFVGAPIEVAVQHLHDAPQALRERVPEISPAIEHVVLKALAKEPQERFPSVQAFAEALEQASSGKAKTTCATPGAERQSSRLPAEFSSSERHKDPMPAGKKKVVLVALSILVVLGTLLSGNALWIAAHQPLLTPTTRISLSPGAKSGTQKSSGATPTVAGPNGPCASSTNWPMLGFDAQNTDYNPDEHLLNRANIPNLQTAWSTYTGYSLNPPVLANGILYVPTSQNVNEPDGTTIQISTLYAISCQTGKIMWQTDLRFPITQGQSYSGYQSDIYSVAVDNGIVYAADGSGLLYALNAHTGATIWQTQITTSNSANTYLNLAPIIFNGTIYLHINNGNIYAVDEKTGHALWKAHTDMNHSIGGGVSVPAIANGVLYVGGSQYLYAFDAQNGSILWRGEIDSIVPFTPVVSQGIVYAAADGGNVFAFNASGCGAMLCGPLWNAYFGLPPSEATPGLPEIVYPPAIANSVLYVGTTADSTFGGGYLFAVNARSGAILWKANTGNFQTGEAGTYVSPVVANGVLYFINAGGELFAFQAAGCGSTTCSSFWTTSLRNNFQTGYSITVSSGSVYINTPGGVLYALRLPGA